MKWTTFFTEHRNQRLLCTLLVLALLLALMPGQVERSSLTDPIGDDPLPELTPLKLGESQEQSPETIPPETMPPETDPPETTPETAPPETQPQDVPIDQPESEGQEDGNQGAEGGDETELDLALVMTWYRYGTQATTFVCGPSATVNQSLNTAQLVNNNLKYRFDLTGADAEGHKIQHCAVRAGDGDETEIPLSGTLPIELPEGGAREYTFRITTVTAEGETIVYTYILSCAHSIDLELELVWEERDGPASVRCTPNADAKKTVKSRDLVEHVFSYTPTLTGLAAEGATLLGGTWSAGALNPDGGTIVLEPGKSYELTFEAEYDGMTLYFHFVIDYSEAADVTLSFTWLESGSIPRTILCQPQGQTEAQIRSNQLSAGAVKYEIALLGDDAGNARILNISYTTPSGGGKLEQSGAIPITIPGGATEMSCTVVVSVLVNGQQLRYEILLRCSMDVTLEMTYALADGALRTVRCENGKTRTAESIYDDELEGGSVHYEMTLAGSAAPGVKITDIRCYQSGSGKTLRLQQRDTVTLLLKNGKTGENTFTVTAEDAAGAEYSFTISIPYKHRGEKTVKISASLRDGQTIINGTEVNLAVTAWSEDGSGNVVGYIPANGTDTKLTVTFDGAVVPYISSSGSASEYILHPEDPEIGDSNTHILHIYAEDAYGNYGELTITLRGQRNQSGQKTGTATIYVDMTVMGLGIVDSVRYDVLADEPVSYSIAKAVLGMDLGEPYGASADTLGWKGRYGGTLDKGFFLESLTPGVTANALNGASWSQYGSNEAEILASIDSRFGKGTGLATLWRCIYRNGLNKSSGSGGTYGEFDYTSGSGWLYSLDGVYYPGLSMCQYSLEDGDVLTIRYTLAYGWDVGGGTAGYGNTAGYCVTALNGTYTINHQMQTIEQPDGSRRYICRCCGLEEACAHENTVYTDLGDGTHIKFCNDCRTDIGDPEEHTWDQGETSHTCTACGASAEHRWTEVEGSNTATCTEGGVRTILCTVCSLVREEQTGPKGHALESRWNHTAQSHYQKCAVCLEIIPESQGTHQYAYHSGDNDWYCTVCEAGHDWDYCGNDALTIQSANCTRITYFCGECGLNLVKDGTFEEYHTFENGICTLCGAADPNYNPPTEPPETEIPTDPPETEPPTEPTRKNRRREDEPQNQ